MSNNNNNNTGNNVPTTNNPNTNAHVMTTQLLKTQQRAHDIDLRERDRLENIKKKQFRNEKMVLHNDIQGNNNNNHDQNNNLNNNQNSSQNYFSSSSPGIGGGRGDLLLGSSVGMNSSSASLNTTLNGNTNSPKNSNSGQFSSSKAKPDPWGGKRFIPFCNSEDPREDRTKLEKYLPNTISTSRYSLSPFHLNFIIWKNLWEQFHRRANWFFFFVGILELIPQLESFSAITLITLTVVLLLGMFRSLVEDLKRQAADRVMNNQSVMVLKNFRDREWRTVKSMEVAVGDIILLETSAKNASEAVPCDIVVLGTSEPDDSCAVQSAHVDGEAKWTMKRCLPVTNIPTIDGEPMMDGDELGENFVRQVTRLFEGATISCDRPDGNIHSFHGLLHLRSSLDDYALRISQMLLRGTQLRKAKWVVGVCVYTGNETKALKDHELPTRKWSRIERVVNTLIFISLFVYLLVVIVATVVSAEVSMERVRWYLPDDSTTTKGTDIVVMIFSFIIFFDNAIPISLYVTLEVIELVAAFLIEEDLALYDSATDRRAAVRAPELLPDLGQVSYIFSDKTGTITRNELSLRKFAIKGDIYGTGTTEIGKALSKHNVNNNNNNPIKEESDLLQQQQQQQSQQYNPARRRSSTTVNMNNSTNPPPPPTSPSNSSNNNNTESAGDAQTKAQQTKNARYDEKNILDAELTPFYDPRFDEDTWFHHVDGPHLEKLFTAMAICHTANISLQYNKTRKKSKNIQRLNRMKKYDGESPDECALCEAARKFGIDFIERKGDTITIENRNGSRTSYIIRDVLPFTSERMRMSVLVELPSGHFKLLTKGADSAILPLAVQNERTQKEARTAAELSGEGLRTLVFAERKLSRQFVQEWLRKDDVVKNAGDFYFESINNLRKNLASEIERELNIIGVTGMEDMLQHGVPDCVKALRQANIKMWLVTGDSREAAINIGYSSGMIPIEAHLLELYGIGPKNIDEFRHQVKHPMAPGADLAESLSRSASFVSFNNTNILQKDQNNKDHDDLLPDSPFASFSRRNSSGLKRRVSFNIPDDEENGQDVPLLRKSPTHKNNSDNHNNENLTTPLPKPTDTKLYVAIIDGITFSTIVDSTDEAFQLEAFRALERCSSVICSRFSSSQKARVVNFMTRWIEKTDQKNIISVGVGDGTNDIPMLRATSVGIGMFGVENFDAANAGDFAISQFWFLQRLILNHGRSGYRRFALVIKYFLYKNLLFVGMLFFFAIQCDWTPSSFVPANILGLYNILFTSVPIIVAGIMDRDILKTDDVTKNFPELYWGGQKNEHLNLRGLLPWIGNAVAHSIVCYFICVRMYDPISSEGVTMGADATSVTMFTCIVVVAALQLGFHITSYSTLVLAAFWASVIFGYFWFVMLYSALGPVTSGTAYRVFNNVGFQAQPWLLAFLAIQVCSAREALSNYAIFNIYPFAKMSLKRIIQLADSQDSKLASTTVPYELDVLARREHFYSKKNMGTIAATSHLLTSTSLSSFTDEQVSDKLNLLLQFKDGETEEDFLEGFLGNLTRYKVGAAVATVFSAGIAGLALLNYANTGTQHTSVLEILGWLSFFVTAIGLLVIFFSYEPSRVRPLLHQIMLAALLIAFSGMSIANFVASQRTPDIHPVSMSVSVFGLLVVVRPPLIHIIQYLTIGVTGLALWYQVFRVDAWTMNDIFLRSIEFIIVFLISLIGLVIGEKFDRKLYLMQLAIKKSLLVAAEAERRSLVLLNNVLPTSIVAEMSQSRVHRNLTDFSVTLQSASVLQSDIVSFTAFSSTKQPHQVVEMLNSMFKKFDAHVNQIGIEKIKTIGDAYVVAAGIPCADRYHAEKICSFGLRMLASIKEMNDEGVPSIPDLNIQIRVGAACGPIRAGVIAMEKMRYELFGGTAEDCEKMEQTGKPGRVQVTKSLFLVTKGSFAYDIIYDDEARKDRYFLSEDSEEPYLNQMPSSQLVTTNNKSLPDRFKILEDEDHRRKEVVKSQDPAIGGKLSRYTLAMKNPELEKEFRAYYMTLADHRTNVELAQSTVMYALVASIVALFVGTLLNPVVILQIVVASLLGLSTLVRVGIPFFRDLRQRLHEQWKLFEAQVVSGGLVKDDENVTTDQMSAASSNSSFSSADGAMIVNADESMNTINGATAHNNNNEHMAKKRQDANDPLLEKHTKSTTGIGYVIEILSRPKTTVIIVGIFTLADPIIVLVGVSVSGIGRGSVFITLAAASFIFSQMHLLFLQKIVLASIHLLAVSIAFFVRTAYYEAFNGSRDGGDYIGVLACYILCVGAAYTTERSVRKAFVAQKRVERRNAEIGTTLHLCEKLLANSIPSSIVRRLQEAPDRAVVDEIPEASVLFLYIDGVFPHEHEEEEHAKKNNHNTNQNKKKQSNKNNHHEQDPDEFFNDVDTEAGTTHPAAVSRVSRQNDDTADVVSRMNDVYYVLDALCRYHMVEKIKTLPFLVVSGCPEPLPKHCYRLACLARDAVAFADAYNARNAGQLDGNGRPIHPVRIKAGLHTGRVTAGILGTSKFVYDIFGDTVNLSSRLASNGQWGQISCSEFAKKHLALESVTCSSRGDVFLKGKGNVPVFEVNGATLRIPTPEFMHDINTYLATTPVSQSKQLRKDPHTARWSMKSSLKGGENSNVDLTTLRSSNHGSNNNQQNNNNNSKNNNRLGRQRSNSSLSSLVSDGNMSAHNSNNNVKDPFHSDRNVFSDMIHTPSSGPSSPATKPNANANANSSLFFNSIPLTISSDGDDSSSRQHTPGASISSYPNNQFNNSWSNNNNNDPYNNNNNNNGKKQSPRGPLNPGAPGYASFLTPESGGLLQTGDQSHRSSFSPRNASTTTLPPEIGDEDDDDDDVLFGNSNRNNKKKNNITSTPPSENAGSARTNNLIGSSDPLFPDSLANTFGNSNNNNSNNGGNNKKVVTQHAAKIDHHHQTGKLKNDSFATSEEEDDDDILFGKSKTNNIANNKNNDNNNNNNNNDIIILPNKIQQNKKKSSKDPLFDSSSSSEDDDDVLFGSGNKNNQTYNNNNSFSFNSGIIHTPPTAAVTPETNAKHLHLQNSSSGPVSITITAPGRDTPHPLHSPIQRAVHHHDHPPPPQNNNIQKIGQNNDILDDDNNQVWQRQQHHQQNVHPAHGLNSPSVKTAHQTTNISIAIGTAPTTVDDKKNQKLYSNKNTNGDDNNNGNNKKKYKASALEDSDYDDSDFGKSSDEDSDEEGYNML